MDLGDTVDDRFLIEGVAGRGGMGVVYRACDLRLMEPVALKMVRGTNHVLRERFLREARVLRELSHPGIVRHVAHGALEDGTLYLAMEWLEGEDLKKRLARGGLDVEESVRIVLAAAEALAGAHAMGVVHRDVKPSNLFLAGPTSSLKSVVKVLDFGVARDGDATQAGVTETGVVLGTVGYMAPEQVSSGDDGPLPDARADVFSLGCVLFECLTGQRAFQGPDLVATLAKILFQETPRVSELRPDVSPALDDLVARMICKDPSGRPEDATVVADELRMLGETPAMRATTITGPTVSLTESEQRLVCFILGDTRDAAHADLATAPTLSPIVERQRLGRLRAALEHFKGARVELLQDGSLVVTLVGSGAATDLAARAARCALLLRELLPQAPLVLSTGRGELRQRVPIGQVIDRAATLLQAARTHQAAGRPVPVHLDEVTAGLLGPEFDVTGDTVGLALRGEREPMEVTRTFLGRPTSLVGRDREMATLFAYHDECTSDRASRAVLVTAPPGIGKSRLRYEFLRALRAREREGNLDIWLGRGDPVSAGSAFGMLGQAIRRTAGLLDGEPLEIRRKKLRARVARHVPESGVQRTAEFLGEIVGAEFPDDGSVQLRAARHDAQLMADQKRRAWEDFVGAESDAHPVVIVLEDLHWGDVPTVALVDAALRTLDSQPLFVLALARPEVHTVFPKLWQGRRLQELRLEELKPRACTTLAREVLGEGTSEAVIARIVERAAGNAFYLEELIRAVAEGRGDELPETVLAMIQARLESLEAEARRVLRAASIFGETFWRGGVVALLEGERKTRDVDGWLATLEAREIVVRRPGGRFRDERELVFRHALVRDAAYAMLTEGDRVLGHRLAGRWLERMGERDAAMLAEHYEQGEDHDQAVKWHVEGAVQALEGNDLSAVIARAERGVLRGATGEGRGALRLAQAEAHAWRGENVEVERCATEAEAFCPRGGADFCRAIAHVVDAATRLGHHERALAAVAELIAVADGSRASVIAACECVFSMVVSGRYDTALALMAIAERDVPTEATTQARAAADPLLAAHVARAAGWCALSVGDLGACLRKNEHAAACFGLAGDRRSECLVRASFGAGCVQLGLYEEGLVALRDALSVAEEMGNLRTAAHAMQSLGLALSRQGEIEQAIVYLTLSVETYKEQGDLRYEGFSRIYLSQALSLAGEGVRAEDEATIACGVVETFPPVHAYALGNLARVLLTNGKASSALEHARDAMALAGSLGYIEEGEEELRLAYVEALRAFGEHEAARVALAEARERLLARAAKISVVEWRESFLANVHVNSAIVGASS